MWGFFARGVQFAIRLLPLILIAWGVAVTCFLYGFLVSQRHWFPRDAILGATQTAEVVWDRLRNPNRLRGLRDWSDVSAEDLSKARVVIDEPVDDDSAFLLTGGEGRFLEYCPDHGCAAVILKRDGTLVHGYPYRPGELTTKRTLDLPYGQIIHDDTKDTVPFGLAPLPNGELIVVYDYFGSTPYGGGIARMDKDGHLIWYRRDYSDHWPKITPKNEILDISHNIASGRIRIPLREGHSDALDCASGMLLDVIRVLDLDGRVKEEIPVFEALLASPHRTRLLVNINIFDPLARTDICDPLHTNSVALVGEELAARLEDVQPDDLLLSFHEISALAVIGRADHSLKRLFTGTFIHQHSAHPVPGGKIILFDNLGSSTAGGPSRVLLYDPVTGEERVVFPNDDTPSDVEVFSRAAGNIDLSGDRTRALVSVSLTGKAYEIRLTDGEILTTIHNLHDVRTMPQFRDASKTVRYFTQLGVYYVSPSLID